MRHSPRPRLDARTTDRVETRLRVRYGDGRAEHELFASNISEGGMFIETNRVFPAGTRLILYIDFPRRTIQQWGEVTWAIRIPDHLRGSMVCGMGISFVDSEPSWPKFFRDWKVSAFR